MTHDTSSFRILSLDGGGVWGLVEVNTLIDLYSECATGRQVLGDFDLVAANSAGALVLAALCVDMTLKTRRIVLVMALSFVCAPSFNQSDKVIRGDCRTTPRCPQKSLYAWHRSLAIQSPSVMST